MGAWLSQPECGVPVRQLVTTDRAPSVAAACARANVGWVLGAMVLVALLLATLSASATRTHESYNEHGELQRRRVPLVPWWAALVPLGVGAAWAGAAVPFTLARLRVAEADLRTSGMSKPAWLEFKAANARSHNTVMGSLGSSGIIASSVLSTAL